MEKDKFKAAIYMFGWSHRKLSPYQGKEEASGSSQIQEEDGELL